MMKHILSKACTAVLLALGLASCAPQENDDYALGYVGEVSSGDISFAITPQTSVPNRVDFEHTSAFGFTHLCEWDLGNGVVARGNKVTGEYPQKGDYTVSLTITTAAGKSTTVSQIVKIENDDFTLINTPIYLNLTGGASAAEGKTWVLDRYNNFSAEVAEATGFDVKGHMGLGPINSYGQGWWGASSDAKANWEIYDASFTFVQNGLKLISASNGKGYGRWSVCSGLPGAVKDGDDAVFDYAGGEANFSINEGGTYPTITLTGDAFLAFNCGAQTYELIYQTEEAMALRVANTTENNDWVFVFCRKDLNVEPLKEIKAIPITEDFEAEATQVVWEADLMGELSGIVDNPAPMGINTSPKAYRYQKSTEFYSNLFFATDYSFDLSKQNKVKVKVFIPSYNDYTTDNTVAGDHVANKKLKPQLAVKLHSTAMGGNAWQTQTEIVAEDIPTDKWVELTFDFSTVASREDYDKIVIQFGAEGQSGEGIFFFDDFQFTE